MAFRVLAPWQDYVEEVKTMSPTLGSLQQLRFAWKRVSLGL